MKPGARRPRADERDAMDDLDDAINALVRRGTDTAERETALAEILLAGSPFERPTRPRVSGHESCRELSTKSAEALVIRGLFVWVEYDEVLSGSGC